MHYVCTWNYQGALLTRPQHAGSSPDFTYIIKLNWIYFFSMTTLILISFFLLYFQTERRKLERKADGEARRRNWNERFGDGATQRESLEDSGELNIRRASE